MDTSEESQLLQSDLNVQELLVSNLKLAVIRVLCSIRHLSLGSELIRGEDVLESGVHGPVDVALGADPANLLEHAGLHAPDLVEESLNDPKIDDTLVLVFSCLLSYSSSSSWWPSRRWRRRRTWRGRPP